MSHDKNELDVQKTATNKNISTRGKWLLAIGTIVFGAVAIIGMALGPSEGTGEERAFWQVLWPVIVMGIWFVVLSCFFEYKIRHSR